jgi:1-acyl-sn-glycerol-3-phosphate acyltransferase
VAEEPEEVPADERRVEEPPTRFDLALYGFVRLVLVSSWARVWFRLQVVDRDRVPAHGPYVIAPVHRSNIDFLLTAALTRRRVRYVAKDSLWNVAPLGWVISILGGFPVRRGKADREALRTCMQVIENGEPLVMFPEGTRQSGPVVGDVFDGPAYVAARMGVPLLPVGIGGTEAAMPKGAQWIKPHKVVLTVGEPIEPPKGDGSGRVPRRIVREMTTQLRTAVQALYDAAQARAGIRPTSTAETDSDADAGPDADAEAQAQST